MTDDQREGIDSPPKIDPINVSDVALKTAYIREQFQGDEAATLDAIARGALDTVTDAQTARIRKDLQAAAQKASDEAWSETPPGRLAAAAAAAEASNERRQRVGLAKELILSEPQRFGLDEATLDAADDQDVIDLAFGKEDTSNLNEYIGPEASDAEKELERRWTSMTKSQIADFVNSEGIPREAVERIAARRATHSWS